MYVLIFRIRVHEFPSETQLARPLMYKILILNCQRWEGHKLVNSKKTVIFGSLLYEEDTANYYIQTLGPKADQNQKVKIKIRLYSN